MTQTVMHQAQSLHAQLPRAQRLVSSRSAKVWQLTTTHLARQRTRLPAALRRSAAAAVTALQHDGEAVVLVDHGSKRAEANAMLEQFAEVYRASSNRQLVRTAHMELAAPSLADTIAECAQLGVSRVIVAPFFLSRGRHISEDIPALVRAAAAEHPELECVIAEPLGTDELLAQLIEKRVQAAAAPAEQH